MMASVQKICSLSYMTVDDAARAIVSMGQGAMLAKVDIKSAYRIVPVHPDDRPLLGMMWKEALYVDSALPFGLRSAPKYFYKYSRCIGVETEEHRHPAGVSLLR